MRPAGSGTGIAAAHRDQGVRFWPMGASASLSTSEVTVAPGAEASVDLKVRNTGTVVDQLTFSPIGTASGWMQVEPPQVSLFPGAEETVRVFFRPPRVSTTLAGATPFAVKVASREDPDGSTVEEGVVTVEPFDDRGVELNPRTNRGRRGAKYELALDNRGNTKVSGRFIGNDADDNVTFDFDPPAVGAEPGTAAFTRLKVKPRKTFWRGTPQTRQFQVLVEEEGKPPLAVDGAMLQEQMLPPWLWKAVAAILALLLLLFILYQTILKPSIESTAKTAAQASTEDLENRVNEAIEPITGETVPPSTSIAGLEPPGVTTAPPGGGGGDTTVPGGGAGGATTTIPGGGGAAGGGGVSAFGDPLDFRLATTAPPGGSNSQSFQVPSDLRFALTDIVLQNPNGDTGRLRILRDSDVLLETALENFRDLDYHFVSPFLFGSGQNVTLQLTCLTAGGGGAECGAAASFSGFLGDAP
jgi:hypothetical protein